MKNTRVAAVAALITLPLALTACGGSSDTEGTTGGASAASIPSATKTPLTVLIGSSTDAEATSVKAAVAAWSTKTGTPATVQVATDLPQQAAQGFAAGKPADVIYTSTDVFASWVKAGNLAPYGDALPNKDDYYDGLKKAFTSGGKFYCAPKDFSTLALVINKDMWTKAGLTDADLPKTWEDLEKVSKKLTTPTVKGLAFGPEVQRVGVFMAQAGGGMESDGKATVNSTENVEALTFVKKAMTDGWAAYSSDLGVGWGGEALGKQKAAMVIEGNWITGALQTDYKTLHATFAELPTNRPAPCSTRTAGASPPRAATSAVPSTWSRA